MQQHQSLIPRNFKPASGNPRFLDQTLKLSYSPLFLLPILRLNGMYLGLSVFSDLLPFVIPPGLGFRV
jgi:hypothetical protein